MYLDLEHLYIVLDGSNIANHKPSNKKKAKFNNLEITRGYLQDLKNLYSFKWEIIVDASLMLILSSLGSISLFVSASLNAFKYSRFVKIAIIIQIAKNAITIMLI